MNPTIKDLLVNLRFRGGYTPAARRLLQKKVVANDLNGYVKALGKGDNWLGVPEDRFKRRKAFAESAVK